MKKLAYFIILIAALGFFLTGCQDTPNPTEVPDSGQGELNSLMKPGITWLVPGDFATIQAAIDHADVTDGDTIMVDPGSHAGALVNKTVIIKGSDGTIIDSGPGHPSGLSQGFRLLAGSDGCTISHLTFTFPIDLSIMNGDGVDDVTVTHCTFLNSIQAVSNWRGSGWNISHNKIIDLRTRCGGGIGILVADYSGGIVADNLVSQNKIMGTLHVSVGDCGGYNGSGIVIYADFRWSRLGADEIKNNHVVKNKVSMFSDTPALVDIAAFELTDTRDEAGVDPCLVIFDNSIGFNDWRGTELQMAFSHAALEACNNISRNLGNNRGDSSHPSLFGPGGN